MPQTQELSPEARIRLRRKQIFDALLVERFHAAFEAERYSDALKLMEIRERLEDRLAFKASYF